MSHVLYSKGRLRKNFNHDEAVVKLAEMTRKSVEQVEERLLNGKPKRIKSSDSLDKLYRLKTKLESNGLDVYIEVNAE